MVAIDATLDSCKTPDKSNIFVFTLINFSQYLVPFKFSFLLIVLCTTGFSLYCFMYKIASQK